MLDMKLWTEFLNILVFERVTIISNNSQKDSILAYDIIKDNIGNLCAGSSGHMNGFNPFGEIFCSIDNELMAIGRGKVNLTYEVESPLRKIPRRYDRLEFLCWRMNQVSMNLTFPTLI